MKIAVPDLISNSYFPALAAVELGTFAAEGIDAELAVIFPPDRAYAAMRAGEVDLVAASAHAALGAYRGFKGVRFPCAQSRGMYWFLVLHSDFGAKRGDLDALRGKRIGAAPWVELGLRGILADLGLDDADAGITIGPVPKIEGVGPNFGLMAYKALEARAIDGFWANGMAAELAVRHGVGDIVLDARRGDGPDGAFGFTFASLAVDEKALARDPELGPATIRAITNAQALLKADISRAAAVGERLFPPEEASLIKDLVARDLPFYSPAITPEDTAALVRFARARGILDADVPHDDLVIAQTPR